MKVKLSKDLKGNEVTFEHPSVLSRGSTLLMTDEYGENGIILHSEEYMIGSQISDVDWESQGWTLYEGTVTLSNK